VIGQSGQNKSAGFDTNARAKLEEVRIKRTGKKKKMQKIVKNLQKLTKMRAFWTQTAPN
jgi:hypothetical protein